MSVAFALLGLRDTTRHPSCARFEKENDRNPSELENVGGHGFLPEVRVMRAM
jgi:hypothetical protein